MRILALVPIACALVSACHPGTTLARYPPPPAGSFTTINAGVAAAGISEPAPGATVTPDFFRTTTMRPLLGRLFMAEDYAAGATRLVLLSEDLWRRRFGGAPDIIGTTIDIDGTPATIVGIIPYAFQYPPDATFWMTSR